MPNDLDTLCQLAHQNKHREKLPGHEETHVFYPSSTHYIHFINHRLPKDKILAGWKFVVSVHPDDLLRAWLLVQDILLCDDRGALAFKVLDVFDCERYGFVKHGEQMVLYTFKNAENELLQSPEALFEILIRVERTLRINKIKSGIASEANLNITASRYISMRHDRDINLEYIPETKALELNPQCPHNPFQFENPYYWFTMSNKQLRHFLQPGIPHDQSNHLQSALTFR